MIRIHGKNKFCEKCTKNILSSKDPTADPIFTLMRKEFSDKDLCCRSYNLKTYNIKRDWNNPKGWANPEYFNKYRW